MIKQSGGGGTFKGGEQERASTCDYRKDNRDLSNNVGIPVIDYEDVRGIGGVNNANGSKNEKNDLLSQYFNNKKQMRIEK